MLTEPMPLLSTGSRLGPYEIVASLGRGGMSACGCGARAAGVPNAAAALGWPMRVEPQRAGVGPREQ